MPLQSRHRNVPAVAILNAESAVGLAFTRSLGRAGVHVRVYSPHNLPLARLSRYCDDFARCPPLTDPDTFLPWLAEEVAQQRIAFVAPTSDLVAFYMAQFPDVFPKPQQASLPGRDALLDVLMQERLAGTCQTGPLRTPWSAFPTSFQEALDNAASLPYPVIIKPKSRLVMGGMRGAVVKNEVDLHRQYHPYHTTDRQPIMELFPQLRWPMLQEYIPAAVDTVFSVSGLLGNDGTVLAAAGSRRMVQWPTTLGVSVMFEPWTDRGAIDLGLGFVQRVLQRGLFELDMMYDRRTDDYVVLGISPHAHRHISLDIARDNDLPVMWYHVACGDTQAPHAMARDNVRWLHSIPFHVGALMDMARGPARRDRLVTYVQTIQGNLVDIINDVSDPLPSVGHAAIMLRHASHRLKALL